MKKIVAPFGKDVAMSLKAGEQILLSGTIYTARDAAHKRMIEALNNGEALPFDIKDQIIYYAGPAPAKPGEIIGSCGPTTSGRVDIYTPPLLDLGLSAMIGKGTRTNEVVDSIKKNKAVYFAAVGGAGALIAKCIKSKSPVAYDDLGTEAIVRLEVVDMPLTVVIDSNGNDLYKTQKTLYREV